MVAGASTANAEVFFGTYTPSQNDVFLTSNNNIHPDPWWYQLREHHERASASTRSDFESFLVLFNVFGTQFGTNTLSNEFVAEGTFIASHLSLAVSWTTIAMDTLADGFVHRSRSRLRMARPCPRPGRWRWLRLRA